MKKQHVPYDKWFSLLRNICYSHPKVTIGKHIHRALDGADMLTIDNNKFFSLLEVYSDRLAIDIVHDEEVDEIIKQGMKLSTILEEDE